MYLILYRNHYRAKNIVYYLYPIGVVGRHFARAAKALVVSKPIAIFHPGDGKS